MGNNGEIDDLRLGFCFFEQSPFFKWSRLENQDEDKPRKPSKVKSKRIVSTKPEHIKIYRT